MENVAYRFGKHRKPAILEEAAASHLGISSKNAEEEKERARKAAREEQQRIQEQYKILLQRQMDMQQVIECLVSFTIVCSK